MNDWLDDDPKLPSFMIRNAENTPKAAFGGNPWKWETTKAMQEKINKDKKKADKEAAFQPVLQAVLDGHSTVGKIKKATGIETPMIQHALLRLLKRKHVAKMGRQYLPF